jgi:hypothetical protein
VRSGSCATYYIAEFAIGARALREYEHDIMKWWEDFGSRPPFSNDADITLLMLLGVSACFSAADDGTAELPFDSLSGVLRPEQWQPWLDWDPVRMVPHYAERCGRCGSMPGRETSGTWTSALTRSGPR